MTPRANRSLPPPFYEIGAVKFQELCADLMGEDQIYLNPVVYGRNGTSQRGIDIEAPLRDKTGLHVGQCKAWAEPSSRAVRQATEEFLPHAKFWQDQGLKKFILLIGCAVDDQKSQDQLREETKRFKAIGVEYEFWDARILRRKLRPYRHIVRNHCEPLNYWEDFICGLGTTSLDASGQAGLNAIVSHQGTLVLELSESRNRELATILELWEEGAARDALSRVIAFCQTPTWPELTSEVRSKSLRIRAALTLALDCNPTEARRLLEQTRALAPESCMALEASVVRCEAGVSAGLAILTTPNTLDAWNVRLGLLLEAGQPGAVLSELPKVPVHTPKNSNTAWAEAMALLCLKRVEEARRVLVDTTSFHPRSLKLKLALAIVRYVAGISTAFPAWGHLTWPVPPPWQLVKRDEESRKERARAADDFAQLASKVEADERREMLIWRLACLGNEPGLQSEAASLCGSILAQWPSYVPAVVWAQERDFAFDKQTSIGALRARMAVADTQADEIIALFSLVGDNEGLAAGEKVLDDMRKRFESTGTISVWRAHKVQCLVARGEMEAALNLVEAEADPVRKRQVRQAMLGAKARKDGDHSTLGEEFKAEFKESGTGHALLAWCESRRVARDWTFMADHSEELIRLVGTDSALRMGVEGAINGRRPELVLKLLKEHVGLCPGGVLPPDLERVRAEAFKQLGHMSQAVQALEKAASISPDTGTLMHLFRLKRSKGDLIGSAETARLFLTLPDVPPEFLTEEVIPAIRRVAPELTRELVLKAKQSLPEDSPALLLVAQQASKLGLDHIANEVFGKLPLWAQQGVPGIIAVDTPRMTEILREQAESWADAIQQYRRGLMPVHGLSFHFNVMLARWFLETSRINIEDGFPLRCKPVLTRHGARANEQPAILERNHELFLDVTSVLLLYSLNLLEVVESAFPSIAVPARLTAWLHAEVDKLQPEQPEVMAAQEQALQLVDAAKVHVWSNTPGFSQPAEAWAEKMGPTWCERHARVKAIGGVLVDSIPLVANRPEMELVVLPENEAGYVIGETEVIASLHNAGIISATEATYAYKKLGHAVPDGSRPAHPIQLHPGLEVHLETGIAERLCLGRVLKPLSEAVSVFVHEFQAAQWRELVNRTQLDAKLLPEIERLIAHISRRFDTNQYRGHECAKPYIPPEHPGPLSDKELCIQDNFDYAENGTGIWCNDDRFLRGLRRGPDRPCADTFDLVQHLRRSGALDDEQIYDVLIRLRAANLRYLPVTKSEVLHHLRKAQVDRWELVETRALGILRRSVAASLLDAEWLQRPVETPQGQRFLLESEFPVQLYLSFASCFVEIWNDSGSSVEHRAARAKWLWNQLSFDVRLMQELFGAPGGGMSASEAVGHSLGHLFGQGFAIRGGERSGGLRATYFQWIFDHCMAANLINNPEVLTHVAASLRRLVDDSLKEMEEAEKTSGPNSVEFVGRMILMGQFLVDLPLPILDALKLTPAELKRFGLAPAVAPYEVLGIGIEPYEFWPAVSRALDRGYAAILKLGVRVQMTRDDKTGRIWIRRKGKDERNGGYLNVPCLPLLSPRKADRIKGLNSCANWFDLGESERREIFEQLVDIEKPAERMRQFHGSLDKSAAWFYRRFEERAKDPQARIQPLNISDLLPSDLSCLRRHLRLEPPTDQIEPSWVDAAATLLLEEGLEETLVRLSCLPVRLPGIVFERLAALNQVEAASLLSQVSVRLQSPLQRLQFLLIGLRFGGDLPTTIPKAKRDLAKLLNPETGTHAANALIALLKCSSLRFGWSDMTQAWSPETRLRVAWVHAGRMHSAIAAGGVSHKEFADWVSSQSQEISLASICPAKELGWDAASPSGLNGPMLLMFAVADFIAQLPAEIVAQLEFPSLFKMWAPTEEALFATLSAVWHQTNLRTNVLGSYLGDLNEEAVHSFVGDAVSGFFSRTPPKVACDRAVAELLENPYQPGPWSLVHLTTNGGPLAEPQAADMDRVVQGLRLSEALERDSTEVQQLILLASDFVSRNRPSQVTEGFLSQLFQLAAKCAVIFQRNSVMPGGEDDASRIGAALFEATWECSVVRDDVSGSISRFTQNLSLLLARWPSLARIAHMALAGVTQRLPLKHQGSLWRAILSCRAWS